VGLLAPFSSGAAGPACGGVWWLLTPTAAPGDGVCGAAVKGRICRDSLRAGYEAGRTEAQGRSPGRSDPPRHRAGLLRELRAGAVIDGGDVSALRCDRRRVRAELSPGIWRAARTSAARARPGDTFTRGPPDTFALLRGTSGHATGGTPGARQPRAGDVSLLSATDRAATCRAGLDEPASAFCPVGGRTCAYASVETSGWLRRGSD
jgi:hypothetical protein